MIRIEAAGKVLDTAPIARLITEGEQNADRIEIVLPEVYGELDLTALTWILAGVSDKETRVEQLLEKKRQDGQLLLCWTVDGSWTAVSGRLTLELSGLSVDGSTVMKLVGRPIEVRPAAEGYGTPVPGIGEQYLAAMRGLTVQAEGAAERAQNAAASLASVGIQVLGFYPSLEALEAAAPNPGIGDLYGVGTSPGVYGYAWNGVAWSKGMPLDLMAFSSNENILQNWYFADPVNSRGQTVYGVAGEETIDGWKIYREGTVTLTGQGIRLQNVGDWGTQIGIGFVPTGRPVTFSVLTDTGLGFVTHTFSGMANEDLLVDLGNGITLGSSYNWWESGTLLVYLQAGDATVKAVKLELGSMQTLARQGANGWELIDPRPKPWVTVEPVRVSNENILDNWYWEDRAAIINRRGRESYTAADDTIDRWLADPNNGGIEVSAQDGFLRVRQTTAGTLWQSISQEVENSAAFSGKTVTLSALLRGTGYHQILLFANWEVIPGSISSIPASEGWTLLTTTVTLPSITTSNLRAYLYADTSGGLGYTDYKAVKLELGSVQTLARQGANGWELIDPLPKPWVTVEPVRASNENLLDNWYWANRASVVNQRGRTSYTGSGYTIDRWRASFTSRQQTDLVSNGVKVGLIANPDLVPAADLLQTLENAQGLSGKTITFSAMATESTASRGGLFLQWKENGTVRSAHKLFATAGLWSVSATPADHATITDLIAAVRGMDMRAGDGAAAYTVFSAVKLELGSVQTLARQGANGWELIDPPPDYGQELAKCQRYLQRVSQNARCRMSDYNANALRFFVPTPVTLRALPAITGGENFMVRTTGLSGTSGFIFTVVVVADNGVVVEAQKTAHGMTDGELFANGNVFLDANL